MNRIGLDLDETLVYGDVVAEAGRQLGIFQSNSDITDFDLSGLDPKVKARAIELFNDPEFAATKKQFLPGVPYFLDYIQHNRCIHIITSRPAHLLEPTKSMFKRECITIHNIEFHFSSKKITTTMTSKLETLKKCKLDGYFDDAIHNCDAALEAGVPQVFLISNKHTPWNHKEIDPRIRRIKSVIELKLWEL